MLPRSGLFAPGRWRPMRSALRTSFSQQRHFVTPNYRRPQAGSISQELNLEDIKQRAQTHASRRLAFLIAGSVTGITMTVLISIDLYKATRKSLDDGFQTKDQENYREKYDGKIHQDSNTPGMTDGEDGVKRKIVIHDDLGRELVPTGHSTIENFPRILNVDQLDSSSSTSDMEYTIIGLGLRTVTIFGIQVYLVGMYVATADIARLQSYLVKRIDPIATTLVPAERDSLRFLLLEPAGEELWDRLIYETGCRTLFRIIPVRDTSLTHMRDAFVTGSTSRANRHSDRTIAQDQAFGTAVSQLKRMFGKGGSMKKGDELLLVRSGKGDMTVLMGDGKMGKREELGTVEDERVSRMIWLNYLAGKQVSSDQARRNIVEGIMEFVERPVGTVAAQIV